MKRVKNSDIKFKINKKLVYLPNFVIRFYTVNQKEYFFEKTQDDLVEYEREATVDDVEVILSGGTTVTEYYLPLNWSELLFVGQGILNYKLTNNIEDPEFPDYQYNKEEVVTTDFYIDSIKVDPEPDEGLIERVVHLEEHLAEEIVNREEADAAISGAVDTEIARAISAETALQEAIDAEETRATSAETHLQTEITELSGTVATYDDRITRAQEDARQAFEQTEAEIARSTAAEAALDVKIGTVSGNVISETTRATTAENALSGAIDSISAATSGSVEELDAKIDTVSGNVITEEARAKGVENALSGAIDTIDAKFIDDAKYEMSGQTHVINFYNGNTVKASIDCTDFLVDGMIDNVYIENGYLVIDFNTASGKQDIRIPLTDIFNPNNYYTKSETSGATEIANALALKLNISDFNTYSGAVETALGEKASQSDLEVLSGTVEDNEEVTAAALNVLNETLSGKADSSAVYLKSETSGATELATAFAAKQDQLIAGENITISGNVISATGGGSDINVVQTTGTSTADVMSQDAVTTQLNNKANKTAAVGGYKFGSINNTNYLKYTNVNRDDLGNSIYYPTINGKGILTNNSTWAQNNYNFNLVETSAFTAHTADTTIHVTAQDKTNWNAKSDFSGSYNDLTDKPTIPTVPTSNTAFTNDAGYATSGYVDSSVSGKVDTTTYNAYTAATDTALASKQTTLTAGTGISIIDNVISATGGSSITVDSALDSGSTNPVENQALWDELRLGGAGLVETTIEWSGKNSTNYPTGSTEIKLEFTSECDSSIYFINENNVTLGNVNIQYHPQWGMVNVNTSSFQGATYEISGSTITISYPSVTNVTKLQTTIYNYATVKAIYNDPLIVLKDQVTGNTAAIKAKVDTSTFNSYASSVDIALARKLNISDYVVDSIITQGSTNPVQNQALYSELRLIDGGETETTLTFEGSDTTNYPQGCTKIKVEDITNYSSNTIYFNGDNWANFGSIDVSNWGSVSVTNNFDGATYEISGTTVIISYPTVTTVTKLNVGENGRYTYKAITTEPPTALKDQVVANTTALATKQTILTAGTGIDITANVISVTGGTGGGISSAECQTMIDQSISGKTNQSDFIGHTANTTAHVTQSEKNTWNAKSDFSGSYNDLTDKPTIPNYTAGSGITISNNVISAKIWSGTQAQYDALAVKDNDTIYLIYNS